MIKSIDFPEKTFASKEELFTELRNNAEKIIAVKKAQVQKSFEKGFAFDGFLMSHLPENETAKVGPQMKDGFVYPVINTTRYMDSHKDVHFDGIWTKTVKEQAGKLFYVMDHDLKVASVIAWQADVNAMVKTVPWGWVGKNYEGNTEALIYEIPKEKIVNPFAKQVIEEKRPVQNSVRMMYVKIQLGMNSSDKENLKYKEYYDKWINEIANKDEVEECGYFWGVEEAKIIKEGSMVLAGSNDATPVRQKENENEPGQPIQHKEEPVDTTLLPQTKFINPNLY